MSELSPICQRKTLLGKSVITLSDASKAGIVSEVWVDIQQRRVVYLSCQGKSKTAMGVSLAQIGVLGEDAILVTSAQSLTEVAPETVTRFVDHEVVTEGGKRLGQIDDFYFDRTTGEITNCLISSGGFASLFEGHSSLEGSEFLVIGAERAIVKAGAEDRLIQVDKGLNQWMELGKTKVQETAATLRERMTKKEETPTIETPTDETGSIS